MRIAASDMQKSERNFAPSTTRGNRYGDVMTTPLRAAVLGYGLAGRVFHCPFINAVPGLELAAIVQRHGDTAAAAYPSARILRDVEAAVADRSIDLISVGTPNATHFEFARAALQAGKHVVVDKPLTATSAEARALIELAAERKLVLAPFQNRRLDADFLTLSDILRQDLIGRPVTIYSHMDRYRPLKRPNTWKEESDGASGLLYDLGPHLLDQPLALFGAPESLTATVRHTRDQTDIDDFFEVALTYPASHPTAPGLRYIASASMLAADPAPRFRAHGTLGTYTKYGLDPQEPALLAGATVPPVGSAEPWLPEAEAAWGTLTTATKLSEPVALDRRAYPSLTGDMRVFYSNVRDAILGQARLMIQPEDGYRVVRLIELAIASDGKRIPVDLS